MSDSELDALDEFEGVPRTYQRIETNIHTTDGILENVSVYTVREKKEFVQPTDAYLAVIKAAAAKFHFPQAYRRMLENIK